MLERALPGDGVVGDDVDTPPLVGLGLDAVRIRYAPTMSARVDAELNRETGKREHCVHALRREAMCGCGDVFVFDVDRNIGAEASHQRDTVFARCCGNMRAPRSLANWTASVPTPPEAPCTVTLSSFFLTCSARAHASTSTGNAAPSTSAANVASVTTSGGIDCARLLSQRPQTGFRP